MHIDKLVHGLPSVIALVGPAPAGRIMVFFAPLLRHRTHVLQGLERVRERAKAFRKERCTALLHHVDVGLLTRAYFWLKKDAAPGIDGMTWAQYGEDLAVRLKDLHCRVHCATG